MKRDWIRPFFFVAALYDFVLGLVFLFAWRAVYARFNVTLPNHPAYIMVPALLIAIFGVGFWFVAQAPERNRDIIKMGIMLKLAYAVPVLIYYYQGQMPPMWVPFAWIDLAFMLAFIGALRAVGAGRGAEG